MSDQPLPPKFRLSEAEANTPLWRKVKQHLAERIDWLHKRIEQTAPIEKTEKLRGQIKEVRHLMTLDNPAPSAEGVDDDIKQY